MNTEELMIELAYFRAANFDDPLKVDCIEYLVLSNPDPNTNNKPAKQQIEDAIKIYTEKMRAKLCV